MDSPDSTAIEACSSRPIRLLTTLPVDVVWDILSFLPYQECWRLVFVNRAMREHALAFLGHVLKHKFGQAGWTMTLETYLNCHHRLFGLDPNSSFEAISLHFDRRTLDLCASLDGTNQRITHVCPNCESTVSVDFTLTMRKPATKFSSKKSCVHKSDALVERPLGTGPRTPWRDMLTDGTTAKREWMPPLQKYTNVAAIELRATSGEGVRPVVGYALYNSWHEVRVQGGLQQRGGFEFWEMRVVSPALLRAVDEMEWTWEEGDPWDDLDYLMDGETNDSDSLMLKSARNRRSIPRRLNSLVASLKPKKSLVAYFQPKK